MINAMIGKRIMQLRNARGLSQKQLAEMINIPQTTLSFYEIGRSKIPAITLYLIATALEESIEAFFSDVNTENIKQIRPSKSFELFMNEHHSRITIDLDYMQMLKLYGELKEWFDKGQQLRIEANKEAKAQKRGCEADEQNTAKC